MPTIWRFPWNRKFPATPPTRHHNEVTILGSTLCDRCNGLKLGRSLRDNVDTTYGTIAIVSVSSLEDTCSLCQQFRTILGIANAWESPDISHTEFHLSRHVFDVLTTKGGSFYGHYLGIRFQHATQIIRLLPTHGIVRKAIAGDRIPLGRAFETAFTNFEMIRELLETCRTAHDWSCQPSHAMTNRLRLIDCRNRQIISAAADQPYVCLSYVWGQNAVAEQATGSSLPEELPKTIEDSIFVALNIGVPYLWVDRYCIDQHNEEEKHDIIQHMDRIYKGAELTIIAAIGTDPNHGLPGIRGTPRKPQFTLAGEETTYVAAEEVAAEIANSKWATRGWTYQEMLLSCRRLVFTNTQMYFQCGNESIIESLNPELASGIFRRTYRVFTRERYPARQRYIHECLEEFYQRQLSYKTDTINATLGIISDITLAGKQWNSTLVTHFYGMPASCSLLESDREGYSETRPAFIRDLLWTTDTNERYDQPTTNLFPSWSWASAKANQPADATDTLNLATKVPRIDHLQDYDGVEILVCHKLKGLVKIKDFPLLQEDYKNFHPWIEVSTWVRSCQIDRDGPYSGRIGLAKHVIIRDAFALGKGTIHAVCLTTPNLNLERRTSSISGLLVVETEPGSYRRVDIFSVKVDLADQHLSAEAASELRTAYERGEHSYRELKKHNWTGPQMLAKLPGGHWQKRTMRLV